MYQDLEHIVNKNRFNNEFKKSKNKFLLVDRFSLDTILKKCLIAKIINKNYKFEPIVLHEQRNDALKLKIYRYFKIKNFIKINSYKNYLNFFVKSLILTLKSILGISLKNFSWFINDFSIYKIKVGDLFYDSYIRYQHNFSKRNHLSFFFFKSIFFSSFRFLFLYDFLKKNFLNVKICIVGQHSYANNSTILFRICEKKFNKIKFFITVGQEFLYYKFPKKDLYRLPFSIRPNYLKKINFLNKKIKDHYMNYLKLRNKGKVIQSHDNMNANFKKKMFSKKQILKKMKISDGIKFDGIILFAAHVFADGPHGCGKLLYDDYYQQLIENVELMKKNKNILYILKSHPSSFLLHEEGFLEDFYYKNGLDEFYNIKLCPKDIKTNALLSFVDTVATCSGSAGLELAAFYGKRPLLAGSSYYSHLGFTQDCKSKAQFNHYFSNPKSIKSLSKKDKINANKCLYLVECVYKTYNIGNFFPKNIRVYKNRKISLIKDKIYLQKLKKNAKKIKIINDQSFKNFEKVIQYGMSKTLSKQFKPNL